MKRFIQGFVVGFCCPFLLGAFLVLVLNGVAQAFTSPKLERGFGRTEFRMSQDEVVRLMGTNFTQSGKVPVGSGYAKIGGETGMDYVVLLRIKAANHLAWKYADLTYVVAFDDAGRVLYKARFGT